MKAVVIHQYGGPEVLRFEEHPDPVPGAGEVWSGSPPRV
jgi:NADPH:quinone reductase